MYKQSKLESTHSFLVRDLLTNFWVLQPIPPAVTFSEAQSSKLERLFFHVSVKKDFRALSFEL